MSVSARIPADGAHRRQLLLGGLVVAAWVISIGSQLTGTAVLLHHHTLIEDGPPIWLAIPFFLLGWQVMLAGMMLPASLPTVGTITATLRGNRVRGTTIRLLAGFAAVWTLFGLFAFLGDFVLHRVVDVTPWLAARPWLIEGSVLALAGGYQLSPYKRRSLEACRQPGHLVARTAAQDTTAFLLGVRHGVDCIGSSWALMLLVFAEGFANLAWMAGLTVVMVLEAMGRNGQRFAVLVGAALLTLAITTLGAGFLAL
jgi:predicted metal-binding membrane protein